MFPACEQEREENVKADVFHAYLSLLKQTRPAQSWLADPDAMEQGETPLTMLQSQVTLLLGQISYLSESFVLYFFALKHIQGPLVRLSAVPILSYRWRRDAFNWTRKL